MPHSLILPDPVVAIIVAVFASALMLYKLIDGLKNLVPFIRDNPKVMKIINFVGNFLVIGAGCFAVGGVHNVFDVLKCLFAAVGASLVSAGFYESKRTSDLARAAATVKELHTEEDKK